VYWFLEEIQLVPGWERFVRRVLDSEKVEIAVSGSSARMLSREVHTSLRGRGMATVIRPFSFREFLRHRGEEPRKEPRRWTPAERSLIEKRFREYLVEGGFPEAQGVPTTPRIELLQGYVDTVLFRDVVERYGVSHVAAPRARDRSTERVGAARRRGWLRQDGRGARGRLLGTPAGHRRGAHAGVRGPVVPRHTSA
jgi:predicted AAA+ superfamily ATPase